MTSVTSLWRRLMRPLWVCHAWLDHDTTRCPGCFTCWDGPGACSTCGAPPPPAQGTWACPRCGATWTGETDPPGAAGRRHRHCWRCGHDWQVP